MTGDTVPARSLNGSAASIDASSMTHTPAWGERWRPGLRRTVWWLGLTGRRLRRAVAERQRRHHLARGDDPAHRAGAQDLRRPGIRGPAMLDLRYPPPAGLGRDQLLLERLPVDGVVDVAGRVEVGAAERPRARRGVRGGGRRMSEPRADPPARGRGAV